MGKYFIATHWLKVFILTFQLHLTVTAVCCSVRSTACYAMFEPRHDQCLMTKTVLEKREILAMKDNNDLLNCF